MKTVVTSGKTVEEAILMAVAQLSVQREKLDIEVLEKPVKGLFGLFGGKDAKIRASIKMSLTDIAKGFLAELFDKMGLEAKLDVTENEDGIFINVSGPNMGILIGHRGETLDAVQYLATLVINNQSDKYSRIVIDTENYRRKREETLSRLAKRLARKVYKTKRRVILEPMNPFERRIIHSALQNDQYIKTYSEGEEPYRKVVIALK